MREIDEMAVAALLADKSIKWEEEILRGDEDSNLADSIMGINQLIVKRFKCDAGISIYYVWHQPKMHSRKAKWFIRDW